MTPLERYAALTCTHDAVYDAVVILDKAWGYGAEVRDLAAELNFPESIVRRYLEDLHAAGLVQWAPELGVAWYCAGLPVLGDVA